MIRPVLFVAFASVFAALPSAASAQKGKGGPSGMSGGQQCQKSTPTMPISYQQPSYRVPGGPMQAYPGKPGYNQNSPYAPLTQSVFPSPASALQQTASMLRILLNQVKNLRLDSAATQALTADLKAAERLAVTYSLAAAQKELQTLEILEQVLADLQTLADENSLPATQQSGLASLLLRFGQMTQGVQQHSALSQRTR